MCASNSPRSDQRHIQQDPRIYRVPDMALEVCRRVGIPPKQTAMIGDTIADMNMAHKAGYGWAIGVASGALSAKALAPHADLVIPDVNAIEVIMPDEDEER